MGRFQQDALSQKTCRIKKNNIQLSGERRDPTKACTPAGGHFFPEAVTEKNYL
jgi:hypothetical protein